MVEVLDPPDQLLRVSPRWTPAALKLVKIPLPSCPHTHTRLTFCSAAPPVLSLLSSASDPGSSSPASQPQFSDKHEDRGVTAV